ncbi:MAG: WG repeat-containing protein [Rhodocyclales bacterium]|nr:WG repeat-containing protein [Rhodocyclales bacterium]
MVPIYGLVPAIPRSMRLSVNMTPRGVRGDESEGIFVHFFKERLMILLGRTGSLAIATLTLFAPLSALTAEGDAKLFPQCGGPFQLCGYVEKDSGVDRIPQRFEVAKTFSEGLAAVRIEGRYGFIDTTGKVVIDPRFQNAGFFTGGYAEIRLNNASGIIDRAGELVVSPQFARIIPFVGDTFIAQPFLNKQRQASSGNERLEAITGPAALSSYNDSGLFHARKGWLSDQKLKFSIFDKPERGLIWAGTKDKNYEDIWGLLRADGTWQVTPRYHHGQQLRESRAIVESMPDYSLPPQQRRDALRRGAVDGDGRLVVPLNFAQLSYWRGGYGLATEGRPFNSDGTQNQVREGIVRADGTLLADRYFDKVEISDDGKLPRGRIGKDWYSIDPNGHMIPDQLEAKTMVECPGGLTIVQRGETVEFRRPGDSRSVGPFDAGYFQRRDCPGPFSAKRDGKWFIVLEDGSVLGGKNGFENLFPFFGNHTAVRVDGKWGIIDRSGAFTVKPSFAQLRPDREGIFVVDEGKEPKWINGYGKRVDKPARDRLLPERTLSCEGGLRFFEKAGLWGLQDTNGKTIIEPKFRALSCFKEGITWAAAPDGKAWCPIGPKGQRRDAMECRENYYPTSRSHDRPEKFSDDPYESSVLWNRAWLDYLAGRRDKPPKWIPWR